MSDDTRTNEELLDEFGDANTSYSYWLKESLRERMEVARSAVLSRMSSPSHARAMAEGGWQDIVGCKFEHNDVVLAYGEFLHGNHPTISAVQYFGLDEVEADYDDGSEVVESDNGWYQIGSDRLFYPTHWMPLPPAPPTPTTKEETA